MVGELEDSVVGLVVGGGGDPVQCARAGGPGRSGGVAFLSLS